MKKFFCVALAAIVLALGTANAHEILPECMLLTVGGDSMSNTLLDGEVIVCAIGNEVRRNDIAVYVLDAKTIIKRIVAVPGDKVYRENGVTHVVYDDGGEIKDEALDDRFALYFIDGSPDDYASYTLGENEYFVVGDNRYNSHDSRDWKDANPENDVGPIRRETIIGTVVGKIK